MHKPTSTGKNKTSYRTRSVLKSSLLIGLATMASRVLGLIRDIVFAATIGATPHADVFFIAFKIPNFLRRLFAEGAFSQAFVPVLTEYQQQQNKEEITRLLSTVAGVLGSILLVLSCLAILGSPLLARVFAPGFIADPEKINLTSSLIKITFPYLMLISLAGFIGAILNTYNRFIIPAITPIWLNITLISSAIIGYIYFDNSVFVLACGVLLAGFIQFFFLLPFLWRLGFRFWPKFAPQHPGVKKIMLLMLPALIGVSVSQVNLLVDTILASFLHAGSISWIYYSNRLTELPLGVFAIAISTVILPNLSREHVNESLERFSYTLDWSVKLVLLISIPATLALITLGKPILITLFMRGSFTFNDVTMTSYSLYAFASGLTFFMLVKVLIPGYYARQDMKTPTKIAVIAMLANIVFNLIIVYPLHVKLNLGHMGLAISTASASLVNAYLLHRGLLKLNIYKVQLHFWPFVIKVIIAATLMTVALHFLCHDPIFWTKLTTLYKSIYLLTLCATGFVIYGCILLLLGVRMKDLRHPP